MFKVLQRGAQRAFLALDAVFNRVFGERLNPLYYLGAISFWMFWVLAASGFYLYAFYRTGVDSTYASIHDLSVHQWWLGGILRSVHRYGSDTMVATMLLHMLRQLVFGRFRGFRAFSWITGVVLLWFTYASGINGFMLPWDRLGEYVATTTAEWLDALPVFRGALVRNFVLPENISDRFFSLLSFLHIGIPLTMLAALWVHTQRVPRARTLPPRPLWVGTTLMLVALSLVAPILGQGPANLSSLPSTLEFDWFYLMVYPLLPAWGPMNVWYLVGGATIALIALPWIGARRNASAQALRVVFHPGDRAVAVRPGETLLDAGLRAGLPLKYECRSGGCGVCMATVVGGRFEHGAVQDSALSTSDRERGRLLMCCATPLSEMSIELPDDDVAQLQAQRYDVKVAAIERLAPDVIALTLALEGERQIEFLAGQYLNILLPDGERRSYSFTTRSDALERIELHIRRVPGGRFSTLLFETLRVGDSLVVEGPLGQFVLREPDTRPIIFVAGATGFAPVKSLLEEAFATGIERSMYFYWGVRHRADLYMAELPERWALEHPNFRFVPVLSEPGDADGWQGRTGLVHEAILADFPDLSNYLVYACGSLNMISAARPAFLAQGLSENACFSDAFTPAASGAGR
jgi:NAD(P)H-flavin reductase/quinol-cytochrome oxidoreductase complex cytochrome b subunit